MGFDARPGVPVAVLVVAYGISRVMAAVSGVRFDDSVIRGTPLTDMWQLLDVRLLRDHLATSVWHLNMQPPLFNLYAGFLVKLPNDVRRPVEAVCALALGLVIVLCTYLLMVELRVPRVAAMVVTLVCVVASPAYLLYENWLNYSYPDRRPRHLRGLVTRPLPAHLNGSGSESASSAPTRPSSSSTAATRSNGCCWPWSRWPSSSVGTGAWSRPWPSCPCWWWSAGT